MLTKIGPCHGVAHRKIWIEGVRLTQAGFTVGTRYDRAEAQGGLVLTVNADGRYKVSGKGEKPIIDISGGIVPSVFPPPATHVSVEYKPGTITITSHIEH